MPKSQYLRQDMGLLRFCRIAIRLLVTRLKPHLFFEHAGVALEKIHAKSIRNEHELLRVDGDLFENLVHGANIHTNTLGQPSVSLALTPQFFSDEISYDNVRFHALWFYFLRGAKIKKCNHTRTSIDKWLTSLRQIVKLLVQQTNCLYKK